MLGLGRNPFKQWGVSPSFRFPFPVIVILLALILTVAFFSTWENNSLGLLGYGISRPRSATVTSQSLNPTVWRVNGTELIWQKPDSPKAVLFLAHGCSGKAGNFWDKSPRCPRCVGLPEERLIVLNALAHNFAVLAVSSVGDCWTYEKERVVVRDVIQWWIRKNGLSRVPLVAMGASSGGYFVSVLANDDTLRFSSIVIMIAEGMFDKMEIRSNYPPTLFVHMPKDSSRNQLIPRNVEKLRKKGVDAKEVKSMEFRLTPKFLADRIPGLNETTSEKLYELFHEKGFIDFNGYMIKDGRKTPWVKALKESKIPFLYGKISTLHVQEELNLAFAYHEMTSLQSKEMFQWFESHMK